MYDKKGTPVLSTILVAIILGIIAVFFLSSCTSHYVESAQARDTLFSVERSRGDVYGIFLTHDESVVYCTPNKELGDKAQALLEHHGEVVVDFASPKFMQNTEGKILGWEDCQAYYTSDGGFSTMVLLDIAGVPSRN